MPIVSGPRVCKLGLFHMDTGARLAVIQAASVAFGTALTIRNCYSDGLKVYGHYNAGGTEQLDTFVPNGNSFVVSKQETPGSINDACFDGLHYWRLGPTNAVMRSGPFVSDITLKSWAHGIASPTGIMTDGQFIIIMSA